MGKTVITTHKNMDLDALGAVLAASKLHPEAEIVLPDTKGSDVIKLLSENEDVINYTEESSFEGKIKKLIIVDTDSIDRIPENVKKNLLENVEIIVYDHHSGTFDTKTKEFHFKRTGSVTSLLTLTLKGKKIIPSPVESSVMLTGIYSDTGSFKFPGTTPLDFIAAAYLLSCGANLEFVKRYLPQELTEEELSYLKTLIDNLNVTEINGNRIGITYARFDSYIGDIAHLISKLIEITGLPAIIGAVEVEKTTFLIGRSRSPKIDVSKVATAFGGGGHKEAASAAIKEKTVFEVLEKLKEILPKAVEPLKKASDIMTAPPITVKQNLTVSEARLILMKNGINAAPVIDESGKITGIINRSLLDKAVYMGLEKEKVENVMERDFYSVSPEDSINIVEEIIIDKHQSFVPVIKDEKPIGVITRTDILVNLHRDEINEIEKFYENRLKVSPKIKNIAQKLKETLPKELFSLIKKIGEIAENEKINAYIIGGFVRDLIIGRKNFDIDIVVEGDATKFAKKIAKLFNAKAHTFDRFKTATVVFPDGNRIDFASARTEVYRSPGALPEVDMAPLKKDLMRRDFTINTLAIKINSKDFGKLIDFFGGLKDIKDKKIRVLHSLSFVEDPTRILRALRFATRYRFELGSHTEKLLKMAVQRKLFKTVEGQRIYHELKQIMLEDNPLRVLNKLEKYKVLSSLFENLNWNRWKKDLFERLRKVTIWHKLNFPEHPISYHLPFFGALFLKEKHEKVENYLNFLAIPEKEKNEILEMCRSIIPTIKKIEKTNKNSEIYSLLKNRSEEFLLLLAAYPESENTREKILKYLKEWRYVKPLVDGKDLINHFKLKPGPLFKEILNKLKYALIDEEIPLDDKEKQLEYVEKVINESRKAN